MPLPRRPSDPAQLAKLVVDMAAGEVPNDKEQVGACRLERAGAAHRARQESQGAGCEPDSGAPGRDSAQRC